MDSKPLISVIVPVYNTEKYLERCVDSILAQTYKNIEIILVDDGSTDKSGEICDNYLKIDKRIMVIHKENGGLSSARNIGMDKSSGLYVGFVDSDDWIEDNMYESLYEGMLNNQSGMACCGRYDVDENMNRMIGLCPSKNECVKGEESLGRLLTWNGIDSSACDKLFDRSLFEEYRFPIGKLSEDVAIMYKVILKANKVWFVSEPYYNYFHRQESITTSKFSDNKLHMDEHSKTILEYVSRNYPKITKNALFFRYKSLIYLYDCIVLSQKDKEKAYKELLIKYADEISSYKRFVQEFDRDRKRIGYRIKVCFMGCPRLYSVIYKVVFKIRNKK